MTKRPKLYTYGSLMYLKDQWQLWLEEVRPKFVFKWMLCQDHVIISFGDDNTTGTLKTFTCNDETLS